MSRKITLAAIIAACVCTSGAFVQTAAAQALSADSDTVSIKVDYADLNLSSEAGAKAVLQRIRQASRQICGDPERSLQRQIQFNTCMKAATNHAVDTMGSPTVTAMNGGQATPPLLLASASH